MDTLSWLVLDWHNAIFTAPIVFWIIYLVYYAMNPSDHEVEHEIDHDVELGHDLGSDHDLGADHEVSAEHDADHEVSADSGGVGHAVMDFLLIGKCPLSIVLMTLGISWGFIGLACNGFFSQLRIVPSWMYVWVSMAIATVLGLIVTRLFAGKLAKWMPRDEVGSVKVSSLVGSCGESSVPIDSRSGRAKVRDQFNALHNIYCRIAAGDEPIAANQAIIVLQHLPGEKIFIVARKPTASEITQFRG